MSAPVRFLALTVAGWAAIRLTALGDVSGFTLAYAKPGGVPPIVPTELASFPDSGPALSAPAAYPAYAGYPPYAAYPQVAYPQAAYPPVAPVRIAVPYYVPVYVPQQPAEQTTELQPRQPWHLPQTAFASLAETFPSLPPPESDFTALADFPREAISTPAVVAPLPQSSKLKRWQLSSWAFLGGPAVPDSLATAGQLGGSQAGARVLYNFNRSLAASLRFTSPIGASTGAQLAGGVRWVPMRSIPIAITAERRQSVSRFGGRSDFALFAEGGLYRRPLPLKLFLDGYFQAGVVGIKRHDLFFDGAATVSRPLFGRISAGFGMWGGAQPQLSRLDVGPRVSVQLRKNVYAHFDWRQHVAGTARPNSGPAVTLATDF